MPRWRLSLPPPAALTSPSCLHRSFWPHCRQLVITPSLDVEWKSCRPLPSIAVHHRPSPRRPSLPSSHHAVLIRPSPLQLQSIAIALALSLTVHRHQRAVAPSIAVKEPSRHPLPLRRTVHHHRGAVHRCQSVYCFQVAVAPSIAVHRFHCRSPSLSITVVIAVHHHRRCDHAVPRSIAVEEPPRHPSPSRSHHAIH